MSGGNGQKQAKDIKLYKREDHRHTLALDTEVHFEEQCIQGMFRCQTQNIGLQGAFLPASSIPVDSRMNVELVLFAPAKSSARQYRLQARVIHTSDKGAGLAFFGLDDEQRQDFRRFLLRAKVAARH